MTHNHVEFTVDLSANSSGEPFVLKAGEIILLRRKAGEGASTSYQCETLKGSVFGSVLGNGIERLGSMQLLKARTRVVRKQPGGDTISSVTVRVSFNDCAVPATLFEGDNAAAAAAAAALSSAPQSSAPVIGRPLVQGPSVAALKPALQTPLKDALLAEEEEGFALTRAQLEHLSCDAELRRMLRDPRLQAVIREVDGSRDRERALQLALDGDPAFQQFSDQLIQLTDRVSSGSR